jgi:hypothetical protein
MKYYSENEVRYILSFCYFSRILEGEICNMHNI